MTLYYCDRCESKFSSREDNLFTLLLPTVNNNLGRQYDLCINCVNYIQRQIEQGIVKQK